MTARIDYFYTCISPWAYLGHRALLDMAAKHGAEVFFRPVDLSKVFEVSGGLPLGQRHPARQRYRFIELQRWQEKRNVPLNFKPEFFPTSPRLADLVAIAVQQNGGPVGDYQEKAFQAVWAHNKNVAEEGVIAEILTSLGQDSDALIEQAGAQATVDQLAANTQMAIEQDVVGSPGYLLNGEPFWGQDRLDLLADALESGRAPFHTL
ncbi:2-hydroxychromene-2-carboxylate isomerase [Rhodobacteraceae bacterium RKSG542]|uniref:2-hydroxychromene-2-carboxylate isomerase n=1 Tax=Pseudovibrio flavus TaxID=2529854 RepID=UPI0012BBF278|nr:2-hydroxychromene-2-carboxylate isomerase [Pseudovibrio flavus]MTI18815.1 2-hydroxychromene-2-carboxylate isomerase [Pseudovibrio flavus]